VCVCVCVNIHKKLYAGIYERDSDDGSATMVCGARMLRDASTLLEAKHTHTHTHTHT
jgi:hypothetical protein